MRIKNFNLCDIDFQVEKARIKSIDSLIIVKHSEVSQFTKAIRHVMIPSNFKFLKGSIKDKIKISGINVLDENERAYLKEVYEIHQKMKRRL